MVINYARISTRKSAQGAGEKESKGSQKKTRMNNRIIG